MVLLSRGNGIVSKKIIFSWRENKNWNIFLKKKWLPELEIQKHYSNFSAQLNLFISRCCRTTYTFLFP